MDDDPLEGYLQPILQCNIDRCIDARPIAKIKTQSLNIQ